MRNHGQSGTGHGAHDVRPTDRWCACRRGRHGRGHLARSEIRWWLNTPKTAVSISHVTTARGLGVHAPVILPRAAVSAPAMSIPARTRRRVATVATTLAMGDFPTPCARAGCLTLPLPDRRPRHAPRAEHPDDRQHEQAAGVRDALSDDPLPVPRAPWSWHQRHRQSRHV